MSENRETYGCVVRATCQDQSVTMTNGTDYDFRTREGWDAAQQRIEELEAQLAERDRRRCGTCAWSTPSRLTHDNFCANDDVEAYYAPHDFGCVLWRAREPQP